MNLLEHYLEPGYTARVLTGDESPVKGVTYVEFDGKVNCYGTVRRTKALFELDEWQEIEKKGYYMA